ncbi:MAG: DNA recombination protein RmuC [Bacteroidales bacterium]|nr:DNA recombination protein RmuC [Bacteroidales bacterium]HOY38536.1 DNA recombination protein RmuC [Bacteroidales bacterium]HQP03089.1 DNA recombination protein RmuC [Bacteroidales bacterium]
MSLIILLIVLISLMVAVLVLTIVFRPSQHNENVAFDNYFKDLQKQINQFEAGLKNEFRINREESAAISKENRTELSNTLKDFRQELSVITKNIADQTTNNNKLLRDEIALVFKDFNENFTKNIQSMNDMQREKFSQLDERQVKLIESTEKRLDQMRETVDEKLQKTLNERLGQSFETVGRQLKEVQEGLGEMRTLAQDVGGLKKVLSNVKDRGGLGELQLEMLLEQILAPEQYAANVKTRHDSSEIVEFAIKLPGRDDQKSHVWLPVDAKFPKDAYEQLLVAYDTADNSIIETAGKNIEATIKKMAKDIHDKYIDPPNTTDFAIMFLPFEGLYAEIIRRSSLMEQLQREFKVVVTGPTTLAAILNSLQMGFRTLALQKRSSEVWTILGAVKTEFEKFGDLLSKAQKQIATAGETIDQLAGTRTRAITRKLKEVQALPAGEAEHVLPEIAQDEIIDEEETIS